MPPPELEDVVVVGAGAAGLAAAAALARRGRDPLVLERDDRVGDTWARRYDRLRLHTIRRFSGLPYRPLPGNLPRYVTKDDYARYLAEYAERLELRVRSGCAVERIAPDRTGSSWTLESSLGQVVARAVVVATGRHNADRPPSWPGLERFTGRVVHSASYRSGNEFARRRVLVVGVGNSGAEIAADLAEEGAARVAIAVRTTPPITSREILGIPVQVLGILLAPFPARAVDRAGGLLRRLANGDLGAYGLGREEWGPFTAGRPPVIDVGFLRELKSGRIEVRPALVRLTESGVVFADGSSEDFDAIVAATGFDTGLERLVGLPGLLDERGLPSGRGAEAARPGLFFIGFRETPRGTLFEAARDARPVAAAVDRHLREAA